MRADPSGTPAPSLACHGRVKRQMDAAYEVKYCKVLDTWTGGYVGWGYFIVELWPVGGRFTLEPIKDNK